MEALSLKTDSWTLERDAYVVLLHLYTLSQTAQITSLAHDRITRDLGFMEASTKSLLQMLLYEGYLEYCGSGQGLTLTQKAVDYIERRAGRRRSLRLLS